VEVEVGSSREERYGSLHLREAGGTARSTQHNNAPTVSDEGKKRAGGYHINMVRSQHITLSRI
jgi:hypothetical protein